MHHNTPHTVSTLWCPMLGGKIPFAKPPFAWWHTSAGVSFRNGSWSYDSKTGHGHGTWMNNLLEVIDALLWWGLPVIFDCQLCLLPVLFGKIILCFWIFWMLRKISRLVSKIPMKTQTSENYLKKIQILTNLTRNERKKEPKNGLMMPEDQLN